MGIDTDGSNALDGELIYERRFGARNQLEVALPFASMPSLGGRTRGVGDLAVGAKRVLHARFDDTTRRGETSAVQAEVSLPTGDDDRGFGAGTPVFTLFGAYDALFSRRSFLQLQAGVDLPADTDAASRAIFARAALGFSRSAGGGFGRTWSPMLEVATEKPLEGGGPWRTDIAPGMQVTLNARQHVRAAVGYRKALTQRRERADQLLFYVLWDWGDGGLGDGW
jgi:hypothetical protein